MAIVYEHVRNDTNQVFYVGIELDTDNKIAVGKRSRKQHGRSNLWKKIINKTSYSINILFNDLTNCEAKEIETYLISYYGRLNLKTGNLVNLTNGGDGTFGYKHTNETKQKIAKKATGRIVSLETKIKIGESSKNRICSLETKLKKSKNMMDNKFFLGRTHSDETKQKMSESAKLRHSLRDYKPSNLESKIQLDTRNE